MTAPRRFRKKPVEIEAMQVTRGNIDVVAEWCQGTLLYGGKLTISTLEGDMRADVGDWIIRGVKGEFYPCKPDVFAETYHPVLGASL